MTRVNSLTDVINALHLDVYKRCFMSDIEKYENNMDKKIRERTNKIYYRLVHEIPATSYSEQPDGVNLFFPLFPDVLEEINVSIDEQRELQKRIDSKRQNEELQCFACNEDTLIAIYRNKQKQDVIYTYLFNYEELHNLSLLSRVVYK
jgi:hypothetical protein